MQALYNLINAHSITRFKYGVLMAIGPFPARSGRYYSAVASTKDDGQNNFNLAKHKSPRVIFPIRPGSYFRIYPLNILQKLFLAAVHPTRLRLKMQLSV